MKLSPKAGLVNFFKLSACLVWVVSAAQAQTFSYKSGDLLIGFRATAGGSYDLVVNAGPVSVFTNLAAGSSLPITAVTGARLKAAFGDTNNLSWSAFACYDTSYPVEAGKNMLFMSRARMELNTQSEPWGSYTKSQQGNVVGKINGVGNGAYNLGTAQSAGVNNTVDALVEPEAANAAPAYSYYSMLGAGLNWGGTFQGNPEQDTGADFTTGNQPVRADLYQIPYGGSQISHPDGTYLGYFEFNTNGVLTYTAGPSSVVIVTPQILSITRVGDTSTVTFTTGAAGTYTLLATGDITAPRANWSVVGSVAGDGQNHALPEVNSGSLRYYAVRAQ